jgi:hypothetical protein
VVSDPERPSALVRVADGVVLVGVILAAVLVAFGPRLGQAEEDHARVLRVVVAVLCVALGFLLVQVRGLRREMLSMDALLDDVRFGAGTKRDRDAIDILVRALRAPDPHAREAALRTLRKLSGLDLGAEPAGWEKWWEGSRATYTRASAKKS